MPVNAQSDYKVNLEEVWEDQKTHKAYFQPDDGMMRLSMFLNENLPPVFGPRHNRENAVDCVIRVLGYFLAAFNKACENPIIPLEPAMGCVSGIQFNTDDRFTVSSSPVSFSSCATIGPPLPPLVESINAIHEAYVHKAIDFAEYQVATRKILANHRIIPDNWAAVEENKKQ